MSDVNSEILPFCPQGDVSLGEIMSLAAYKGDVQRLRGNQPGIARLELVNMALEADSHVAAGVAQFIARRYTAGVKDDADLDALEEGLASAVNDLRAPHALPLGSFRRRRGKRTGHPAFRLFL